MVCSTQLLLYNAYRFLDTNLRANVNRGSCYLRAESWFLSVSNRLHLFHSSIRSWIRRILPLTVLGKLSTNSTWQREKYTTRILWKFIVNRSCRGKLAIFAIVPWCGAIWGFSWGFGYCSISTGYKLPRN